jgi:hypothetical protein
LLGAVEDEIVENLQRAYVLSVELPAQKTQYIAASGPFVHVVFGV